MKAIAVYQRMRVVFLSLLLALLLFMTRTTTLAFALSLLSNNNNKGAPFGASTRGQQQQSKWSNHRSRLSAHETSAIVDDTCTTSEAAATAIHVDHAYYVPILPAGGPLRSFPSATTTKEPEEGTTTNQQQDDDNDEFSVLTWNVLLPNSRDNWWNHKMYAPWVPMEARDWSHRQSLIRDRLLQADADIVCIQEADGDTFYDDFAFMMSEGGGYDSCLHNKFRFRCATCYKRDMFVLDQVAHKDRTLVTSLRSVVDSDNNDDGASNDTSNRRLLHVVNCHLSGGAAPERRLRQVHDALEQVRKWKHKAELALQKQRKANRPSSKGIKKAQDEYELYNNAGIVVCGDFNSDGNTAVRKLLIDGCVDPEWREPQYPDVRLTSKRRQQVHNFVDAAELAYGSNVCDGDYGENHHHALEVGSRPATYVVPNLAEMLLLPVEGEEIPRTQFGYQVARGLADTLGLDEFCNNEIDNAFDAVDLDGNDVLDGDEIRSLLETVYEGRQIDKETLEFFTHDGQGLSRVQFTEKLAALQQELEGGSVGAELVEIRTEADAQRMIARFSPVLRNALDYVFDQFSSDGDKMTEDEVSKFLIKANGQLGRGGTWRHTSSVLDREKEKSEPVVLTREEWYGVFARELGEGKWWQVVYDLEVCGADLHRRDLQASSAAFGKEEEDSEGGHQSPSNNRHYQGWLDYVYFDRTRLRCGGVQEALTDDELTRIYERGDALPNEWHPSDHLPCGAVFTWNSSRARARVD